MYIKHDGDTHNVYYQFDDGHEIIYKVYKQSTIATKFDLIFDQVNTMLAQSPELKELYEKYLIEFNDNPSIVVAQMYLPKLFEMIDVIGEELDYHKFDYTPPNYKNDLRLHINEDEYRLIMIASLRSKFICVHATIMRDINMAVVKYIYSKVIDIMYGSNTIFKIEKVVDSTVMYASSGGLDHKSQLWVVFSAGKGIDPQNIALRERNSVFYKGFPTMMPGRDPIKWIISIVRTSIKFLMKDKVTQVNIAINNPIETTSSSNNKLLQMFIYEKVVGNRQLFKLMGEMPFASSLVSEYVVPITQSITIPFISLVFDMPSINISKLSNLILLNLFTYKFIVNTCSDSNIFNLLICKAIPKNIADEDDVYCIFVKKNLTSAIKKQLKLLEFDKHSTYTIKQLECVFKETFKQIFKYNYIDYSGNKFLMHPDDIVKDYISYIYNLSTGMYKVQVENAKQYLLQSTTVNEFNMEDSDE